MNLFSFSAICAAVLIATAASAAPAPSAGTERSVDARSQGTVVAREAESGDDRRGRGRGKDDTHRDDKGGRRLSDDTGGTLVAREAESGDDRRGRGRGRDDTHRDDKGGRRLSEETHAGVVA